MSRGTKQKAADSEEVLQTKNWTNWTKMMVLASLNLTYIWKQKLIKSK